MIESAHGGKVNDNEWGRRMRGEGEIAELVAGQFQVYNKKYGLNMENWNLDHSSFCRPGSQMKLF
jgi:hypothetical protein